MSHPLTLAEAAARLRKSKRWLQDWLAQNPVDAFGRASFSRLGRTVLFREFDIERIEKVIEAESKRPTFVYFIEMEGHIKIGRTDSWKKRLNTIQTGSPFPARLLLVLKRSQATETELHARFKAHRVRGEWFRDNQDLRTFIENRQFWCVTKASPE